MPLTLLAASPPSAAADNDDASAGRHAPPPRPSSMEGGPPGAPVSSQDKLDVVLGGGVLNLPRYPGSRFDFNRGLPLVSMSYGRFFVGADPVAGAGAPAGIGAYLLHDQHLALGMDIGTDGRKPRRASDDPVLHGWGDIPQATHLGTFARYHRAWLSVTGSVSVASHHQGATASLSAQARWHATPQLTVSIGPSVTWLSSQDAMTFFGVTAAQAGIAGINPHPASAGISQLGGSASVSYTLTSHWSMTGIVSYSRLQGDAADSPVATDKTQRIYGGFITYRFSP